MRGKTAGIIQEETIRYKIKKPHKAGFRGVIEANLNTCLSAFN